MNEKPYFSSVIWLPITSETRIASSRLNTRNAKTRVSHSNALSAQGAERRRRGPGESLLAAAPLGASDWFSVAELIEVAGR